MIKDQDRTSTRRYEERFVRFSMRLGVPMLRASIGVVFVWFGIVKFFPGISPVDKLAVKTVGLLTLHIMSGDMCRLVLAFLETGIGLGVITGRLPRVTLTALFLHMAGTLTPLVLFPHEIWKQPLVASLEGQFIIKNFVLISAGVSITATLLGGGLVAMDAAVSDHHRDTSHRVPSPGEEPSDQ
ncbi:DoxX family protein [Streptomyces sp. 1222.5]|uniref:DoxX family protein n=1 Tax=Streptomyces sp. 1222.5 TaxID=1881026 RepID=UPI003D71041F